MILIFETQCYVNYGSEDTPYWKPKGGRTIKVTNAPDDLSPDAIVGLYDTFSINTEYVQDHVIYHICYLDGATTYEWEQVIDYSDTVNMMLETA
jgi:hypothetical protein